MTSLKQIEKEKQLIARTEKSLAFEKLKQRRADTRRKIEFGGLVIKAKMDGYSPCFRRIGYAVRSQFKMDTSSFDYAFR